MRRQSDPGEISKVRALSSAANAGIVVTLVLLCAAAFMWDWFLTQVMIGLHMNDFGKFYYSARAFLEGQDMYAPSPATDMQEMGQQLLNMNPPHFHVLVLPLATLDPSQALALWMGASIFALVLSLLMIGREVGYRATRQRVLLIVLASLAFSGSQAFFLTGQLSLLLLLPITICWIEARRGHWGRAGAWLGACLSVKPFLLIFLPYLIGRGRVRALVVAVGTAATCLGVGLLVFGVEGYRSWLGALTQSGDWAWTGMNASTLGMFQRVFSATPLFVPLKFAPRLVPFWIVAAGVIGIGTFMVVLDDKTRSSTDRAFAVLLVASQLVSPLGWVYYLWLPAGPIAALASSPVRSGFWRSPASSILGAVTLVGLLTPLTVVYYFRLQGWATLTVGSAYFWATLALWILILLDFAHARHGRPGDSLPTETYATELLRSRRLQ